MNDKLHIRPAHENTSEELKELAEEIRHLADEIEKGEVVAMTWTAHYRGDTLTTDWIKVRGISKFELIGGAYCLLTELERDTTKRKDSG